MGESNYMKQVNESKSQEQTIRSSLFKHCTEGDSGIVFLTTKNNKACKIFLTEGEVQAVTLGKFTGVDAVLELEKVGLKGASFSDKFNLPYAKSAIINSSENLLKRLGYINRSIGRDENDTNYTRA